MYSIMKLIEVRLIWPIHLCFLQNVSLRSTGIQPGGPYAVTICWLKHFLLQLWIPALWYCSDALIVCHWWKALSSRAFTFPLVDPFLPLHSLSYWPAGRASPPPPLPYHYDTLSERLTTGQVSRRREKAREHSDLTEKEEVVKSSIMLHFKVLK